MLSFYNNQRLGLSFLYDTVAWHNKQPNIVYSQGNSVHIRTKGSQSGYELRVYDLKGATPEQFINKEFIQHTSNCKFTNTTGFTHRENSIVSLYFKFEITNMGVDALSEVDCGPFGYQTNHANFFLYNPESRNKLLWVSVPSKEAEVVPILHLVKFFESLTIY